MFVILHYYGISSGLTGVGLTLTFIYEWIMGVLMEEVGDGGLFLPIVAHTQSRITTYFRVWHEEKQKQKQKRQQNHEM